MIDCVTVNGNNPNKMGKRLEKFKVEGGTLVEGLTTLSPTVGKAAGATKGSIPDSEGKDYLHQLGQREKPKLAKLQIKAHYHQF